jgi:flagellar protein FliO/FliZ
MKKLLLIMSAVLMSGMFSSTCFALQLLDSKPSRNFLKDIDVRTSEKIIEITAEFTDNVDMENKKIILNENSLQLELPRLSLNSSKRLFRINDKIISQIFVSRTNQEGLLINVGFLKKIDRKDLTVGIKEKKKLILKIKRPLNGSLAAKKSFEQTKREDADMELKDAKEANEGEGKKSSQVSFDINEFEKLFEKSSAASEEQLINKVVNTKPDELGRLNRDNEKDVRGKDDSLNVGLPLLLNDQKGEKNGEKTIIQKVGAGASEKLQNLKNSDILASSIKMITSLSIVLTLVFVIAYFAKKFMVSQNGFLSKGRMVKVLGSSYIGGKKNITMVEVGNEILLLGISQNNISMLTRLEKTDIESPNPGKRGGRENLFSQELGRYYWRPKNKSKADNVDHITENIKRKIRELKRI